MERVIAHTLLASSLLLAGGLAYGEEPALPAGLNEPALPSGLGGNDEPSLPAGLGGGSEPSLPSGLGNLPALPSGLGSTTDDAQTEEDGWNDNGQDEQPTWHINGFGEARLGDWREDKSYLGQHPIAETRLHVKADKTLDSANINLSADLLYDDSSDERHPRLEAGQGWFDLREANIIFSPNSFTDVKLGRQTLTWGTGDLIFINDLFPKDWNSFLIGRDDSYLKAPSDALKVSLFSEKANLDLVYTPRFDADRYINGERASYYNANTASIAGQNAIVNVEKPDDWFEDDELALRLYRTISTYELALYGYNGFWKSPGGANPSTGTAIFPRLSVLGASVRGPVLGGIANAEWGYYNSKDDSSGNNPLINNSEQRLLIGYEHELISDITLGMQFYTTHMLDYAAYTQTLPTGMPAKRENRHEVSARLTWLALSQKLTTSLFVRYSSSDKDYYLRPKINYRMDDHWSYELGANLFHGKQQHTFFGQFEYNDNLYIAVRFGY